VNNRAAIIQIFVIPVLFLPVLVCGQVTDGFESGQLNHWEQLPAGRWAVSGEDPLSGTRSLRHSFDNPEAGTDLILRSVDRPVHSGKLSSAVRIRHGYAPSKSNNWQFILHAECDSAGEVVEGMVLGVNFSGSDDLIRLWQVVEGGAAGSEIVGSDAQVGVAAVGVAAGSQVVEIIQTGIDFQESIGTLAAPYFKAERVPGGRWTIWCSINGEEAAAVVIGTGQEVEPPGGRLVGIRYSYSSAQDRKLWIDNIRIDGEFSRDTLPPRPVALYAGYPATLKIEFDEHVHPAVDFGCKWNGDGYSAVTTERQVMEIAFNGYFPNRVRQEVLLRGVEDADGNMLPDTVLSFTLDLPEYGDVVIHEIMPDPDPPVAGNVDEYIELFNRSERTFNMQDWMLTVNGRKLIIPGGELPPGGYIVLNCSSFLPNSGGEISLTDRDHRLVHVLDYGDPAVLDPEKAEGGWSLERCDPHAICAGSEGWVFSEDESGGTPGRKNSVTCTLIDSRGPVPEGFGLPDSCLLRLYFRERILEDPGQPAVSLTIDGQPARPQYLSNPHVARTLDFCFPEDVWSDGKAEVALRGARDCNGHRIQPLSAILTLPVIAREGSVLINEIMYEPAESGGEFVELINMTREVIDLSGLGIKFLTEPDQQRAAEPLCRESRLLLPGDMVVVCASEKVLRALYAPADSIVLIEIPGWQSLGNSGGCIHLQNRSLGEVDRVCYTPEMHHDLLAVSSGVSLERISTEGSSDDKRNWTSASFSAGYATPGLPNSISVEREEAVEWVRVSPTVISPDMDGHADLMQISIGSGVAGQVLSVLITDLQGHTVSKLLDHEVGSQEDEVTWHGTDDSGRMVPPGLYVVHVRSWNGSRERVKRIPVAIVYR